MITVRCEGCKAAFDVDERRMPRTGMRVRCPRCGASFHVSPTGATSSASPPSPAAPAAPMKPAGGSRDVEFGSIDDLPSPAGAVDLPSPAAPRGEIDLPAPAAPRGEIDLPSPAAPRGAIDRPSPSAPRDLTDLPATARTSDLPTPARATDLPTPVARNAASARGETDLPSPAARPTIDLPKPVGAARGMTDPAKPVAKDTVDLPSPVGRPAPFVLPSPPPSQEPLELGGFGDELALPGASEPDDFGSGVAGMGTEGLDDPFARDSSPSRKAVTAPQPSAAPRSKPQGPSDLVLDLPAPLHSGSEPPSPRGMLGKVALQRKAVPAADLDAVLPTPVGDAGLPAPASGAALPVPAHAAGTASVPTPAKPREPTAAFGDDASFGELDLPTGSASERPAASTAGATGARSGSGAAAEPPSEPFGFPEFGDLPLPPSAPSAGAAPGSSSSARGSRGSAGGLGFGEVDLGGDADDGGAASLPSTPSSGDAAEFDQIPLEGPKRGDRSVGLAEIETAAPPTAAATARVAPGETGRASATARVGARRTGLYVGLGVAGALVVSGAALALTPAGAFGTKLIDERMHGPARHAAAARAIEDGGRALEQDTWARARRALRDLDAQLEQTPREHALAAFDAYAYYMVLSRFGNDPGLAARARTRYEALGTLPDGTSYVTAARAARDLATGHADRARTTAGRDSALRDLVTMALLEGDDTAATVEAAHASVARRATPRARFLEARALYLAGDRAGARRIAEALAAELPDHAGARLLVAKILSEDAAGAERAIALATEVERLDTRASLDERTEAAVLIGQIEMARDHVRAAREAFERALAIDPRSATALNGAGTMLYRQGSYTEALARFQAARTADDGSIDAKLGIAMASLSLGRPGDARQVLDPLRTSNDSDPRVRFWLAKALVAANELAQAETEFREAIRLDSTNLEAYTSLAALLFSMQRPEAAEQVLRDARSHVSDQAAIHRALGEGRAARGDLAGAETELRAALAARPADVRARFLLAQTLRRLRRFDEAARELDAVARVEAEYPGLLIERGTLAEQRGDAAGALAAFRSAAARSPENPELTVRVAAALVATGQYPEADAMMTRHIAENPTSGEGHFVLGRARLAQNNTADAVRLLERACELDATRADFRAYAAQANLERAQFARALEHANQAIALDGNYARGYWVRGEVRVRQGAAVQAHADAYRALQLEPNFTEAFVTYADAVEGQGHIPEAVSLYRRALERQPNRGEWHARIGRLLADLGRTGEAAAAFERATSLGDAAGTPPPWLAQAHRALGDLLRGRDRARARQHYERFLALAPPGAAGIDEARAAVAELR